MKQFLNSSIIKKVIMSLSGLFLIVFLVVHLSINLLLLVPDGGVLFNEAAHFMGTNPIIKVVEPVLALGFIVHIFMGLVLTYQNWSSTPVKYSKTNEAASSSWAARNMFVLGSVLFLMLALHLVNFWFKVKFNANIDNLNGLDKVVINGEEVHNTYKLVVECFSYGIYVVLYVLLAVALGFHLTHGFWSAFQSLGMNNSCIRKPLEILAKLVGILFGLGFTIIPVLHYLNQTFNLGWF